MLIVADNRDAAKTLALLLRNQGHEVAVAFDGPSACVAPSSVVPDVVLLDIGLPWMDAYELARRLRAGAATSRTRIVAVSGYGQDKDLHRSGSEGLDDHLVKPVDFQRIARVFATLDTAPAPGPRGAS